MRAATAGSEAEGQTTPRQVVTMFFRPGHRLYQISFRADAASAPIAKLWETLRKRKIRVINSTLTSTDHLGGTWSVFLDCEDYGVTPEGLMHLLDGLVALKELKISGGDELIVDDLQFPILSSTGERAMFLTRDSFQRMISVLNDQFGTGGGLISFQEGMAIGARVAGEFRAVVGGDLRRFVDRAVKLYDAYGIGVCDLISADFESYNFTVRLAHNIECEGKTTEKPNSHWVRGHLCGVASNALQVPMECSETKCVAVGDEACEFVLRRLEG